MNIVLVAIQFLGLIAVALPISRLAAAPFLLISLVSMLVVIGMNIAHSLGFTLFNSFKFLAWFGIDHGYALIVLAAFHVCSIVLKPQSGS